MPVKIIHHQEANVIEKKQTDLNIEECLQNMFNVCEKTINFAYHILDSFDFNEMLDENDMSTLDEKYKKIKKIMEMFSMIFGKKLSVLEILTKTTAIMQKIQGLAEKFNIEIIHQNNQGEKEEYMSDEDVDMMMQIVQDFGIEQVKEDIKEYNENLRLKQEKQDEINDKMLDVYDVYKETAESTEENNVAN